jgi:hypothetical protein
MILVGGVRPRAVLWRGGRAAELVSDRSRTELQGFAQQLGIPLAELDAIPGDQPPALLVGPRQRLKALRAGATAATPGQLVEARARWRAVMLEWKRAYRAWLATQPPRGPAPGPTE